MDIVAKIMVEIDNFKRSNQREPEAIVMHPKLFHILNDKEKVIMFDFFSSTLYRVFGLEVIQNASIKDFQLK